MCSYGCSVWTVPLLPRLHDMRIHFIFFKPKKGSECFIFLYCKAGVCIYMTTCIVGLLKHRCAKSLVIDQKSQGSSDTLNCDKKQLKWVLQSKFSILFLLPLLWLDTHAGCQIEHATVTSTSDNGRSFILEANELIYLWFRLFQMNAKAF